MMAAVKEAMTRDAVAISPIESMREAAKIMRQLNVGALPVRDGDRIVGMLTDRDLVVHGLADGMDPDAPIGCLLGKDVPWCFETDDLAVVHARMAREHVSRMPVVDNRKRLIGVVSLVDLARSLSASNR